MAVFRLYFSFRAFSTILSSVPNNIQNTVPLICLEISKGVKSTVALGFGTSTKLLSGKSNRFKVITKPDGTKVTKKVQSSPQIMLIDEKNNRRTVYLEEAEKLAKHAGSQLVQEGSKAGKAVYRLNKVFNFARSSSDKKEQQSKTFIIKTSILTHDLETKINQIIKLLDKKQAAVVFIQKINPSHEFDDIADKIINEIKPKHPDCQKKVTTSSCKISLKPSLNVSKEEEK